MKQNFIDNLKETFVIDESAVLAMAAHLMLEVKVRSFLIWCFEEYGEQAKFKHNDVIYKFKAVNDLGYVTGIDVNGNEVHLQPRQAITKLPTKAFRYFQVEWN